MPHFINHVKITDVLTRFGEHCSHVPNIVEVAEYKGSIKLKTTRYDILGVLSSKLLCLFRFEILLEQIFLVIWTKESVNQSC